MEETNIKELIKLKMLSGTNTNSTKGMLLLILFPYIEKIIKRLLTCSEQKVNTFIKWIMNRLLYSSKQYTCVIESGSILYFELRDMCKKFTCTSDELQSILTTTRDCIKINPVTFSDTRSFENGNIWIPVKFTDEFNQEHHLEYKIALKGAIQLGGDDGKALVHATDHAKYYLYIRSKKKETLNMLYKICEQRLREIREREKLKSCQVMGYYVLKPQDEWVKDSSDSNKLIFNVYDISPKRTFDNLFFPQKQHIINCMNNFNNKKGIYSKTVNKIGFLLHGEPGTGKTTFIKTLANTMKRHVVNIDLSNVYTNEQLEKLVFNCKINTSNNNSIMYSRSELLFVFEDIDCMGEENLLCSRTNEQEEPEEVLKPKPKFKPKKDDDNEEENKFCDIFMKRKRTLTLSGILNVLDGIVDTPERVVIITTNHPEKLDSSSVLSCSFSAVSSRLRFIFLNPFNNTREYLFKPFIHVFRI
jgi:hypothetical protein